MPTLPLTTEAAAAINQAMAQVPGGSLLVTARGEVCHAQAFGRFTYAKESPVVTLETVFDLASVTKVVATTAMAMVLYDRGQLRLDQSLRAIVPEFATDDPRRAVVTLRMLLAHSSGLPAHERYFEKVRTKDEILQAVFTTPLQDGPGIRTKYSDVGFILLGVALERLANESLDSFCARKIFAPLEMTRTRFNPPAEWKPHIPPTRDDAYFRHRIIQGEVNDENAFVLEGVAGHAGVFARAEDVARFALCMLRGGTPIIRPDTIKLFTTRQPIPGGTSRALGWDTPSPPSQAGQHFSASSFGHLGYTGTSLWIDPERDVSITLLTNRTWPDAESQAIKQVRPAIHDAMMEALLSTS
ncbi:MAG TPA: serine hydrolase domain-containing protein [Terriglobales bacterium]|nr:serine hydrolase domain-containing protein [Terriglobales bacterium]